jgi:hypothetical protein
LEGEGKSEHEMSLVVFQLSCYNATMKVNSSIIAAFVAGAIVASLPYTLSSGKTVAQGAGPAQGGGLGGGQAGQGFPRQGQGLPGQGQGQFRQGQLPMNGPMVNSMAASGNFLFASAGDTIFKIEVDSMRIVGQTKLPAPRPVAGGQLGGTGSDSRAGNNSGGGSPSKNK